MALFAGAWQRAGRQLREGIETDLLAALHGPYHGVLSAYDDPSFVVVARALNEPTVVSHAGIVAAVGGRLDGDMNAGHVLDAYMDPGGRFRGVSGDYAIAVFDPRHHTLVLLRDPVGTQPLYYYVGDDGLFVFGSQIKAVLAGAAIPAEPNRRALAQLLVANAGIPRGQTCFAGVQSLPPGQALLVTPDTLSMTTHADLRPIIPTPLRTFDESAAAFKRAFLQSVERRLSPRGPTAVLLSGGLDSSAITAAAAKVHHPNEVLAISYISENSKADEARYSGAVALHTGARSMKVPLEPLEFFERVRTDVWATETPVADYTPGPMLRAAEFARTRGAQHMMTGVWGDQVLFPFPPPFLNELLRTHRVREFMEMTRSISQWMADVPEADVRRAVRRHAVRAFLPSALLDRVRPPKSASSFDALRSSAIVRRQTALDHAGAVRREVTRDNAVAVTESITKSGWGSGVEMQLPFVDADLLQLLFAIPAEHTLAGGRPKALLRSAMNGLMPDEVINRRDKGDYTDPIVAEISARKAECVEALEGLQRAVNFGLMSSGAAQQTLADLKRGREISNDQCIRMADLLSVDSWLAVFFEDGRNERTREQRVAAG